MKNDISIRRAREGDEEALALVGQATFLETFAGVLDGAAIIGHCQKAHSASQYRNWLADADVAIWLAEIVPGDAPVGYLVVAPPDLPMVEIGQDLELKRIYLLSRYHGGGAGKQLLARAIEHAESRRAARLLLGVYSGNTAAIAFYRRQGFSNLAERKFNVGGKVYDDHVMSLALANA
ncbi:MAG: GNAT family N-acetyltransferase [Telluria sp.]